MTRWPGAALRLVLFASAALVAYRDGGGADPATRMPEPAADASDARHRRSPSCAERVLAFRFVDRGAVHRVTGAVRLVGGAGTLNVRSAPIDFPADAVRLQARQIAVDLETSPTRAVGFDLVVDSDDLELSWDFKLDAPHPWPFGLVAREGALGASVRALCERPGLADLLATDDRGLFIGCTCR